jgi:hypothetical protein
LPNGGMIIHSRKPHEVIGSVFAVIAKTSLPACPKDFKLLVAYLEGLRAVAPYRRGTDDPRAAVFSEEVAGKAFDKLNAVKK